LILTLIVKLIVWAASSGSVDWTNHGPQPADGKAQSCSSRWSSPAVSPWLPEPEHSNVYGSAVPFLAPSSYPPYTSETSFTLPLIAPLHFLLARGSLASGQVRVQTESSENPDEIGIKVEVRYYTVGARNLAELCLLEREEGGWGLGIYTPVISDPSHHEREQLYFTVTVTLPSPQNNKPLLLNAFETALPNFRHTLDDFDGKVAFERVKIVGSNASIHAASLNATQASLKTSNGPITGHFVAYESLELRTSNKPVEVTVDLWNSAEDAADMSVLKATTLDIHSSNGRINSAVSLRTTLDARLATHQKISEAGGAFALILKTSNAPLDLTFPSTPPHSILSLIGRTSNAPATVALHPYYEGTFALTTSNADSKLVENKIAGRDVTVTKSGKGALAGWVAMKWDGAEEDRQGSVNIKTSNGKNQLRLV